MFAVHWQLDAKRISRRRRKEGFFRLPCEFELGEHAEGELVNQQHDAVIFDRAPSSDFGVGVKFLWRWMLSVYALLPFLYFFAKAGL